MEHLWGERPGKRWENESGEHQFRHVMEEDGKKNHMAKKKIELEAKAVAKRLEETERLVEDANVVLGMGEDAAGLTGVVSASDLAIYDDDDFLLDLGLEFGLRIGL